MVRTGARAEALATALQGAGSASRRVARRRHAPLGADVRASVMALYFELGGQQERPVLRPGAWHLALNGGVVVELDEELHLNRYRP